MASSRYMRVVVLSLVIVVQHQRCEFKPEEGVDVGEEIVCPTTPAPKFPGDSEGLRRYLRENYRVSLGQASAEGVVFVEFLIAQDGSVHDPVIIRGLCEKCDQEALRLITGMPKWEPVVVEGVPKSCKMVMPIKFDLGNNPYAAPNH